MFGRMMIEPVQANPGIDLQAAVAAMTKVTQNVEIVRPIELPASVLLFLPAPGDRILDRSKRWKVARECPDFMMLNEGHFEASHLLLRRRFLAAQDWQKPWRRKVPHR